MDFLRVKVREGKKKGTIEVYPDFDTRKGKDLMTRGRFFYAIWDEENNTWSTDEFDVQRLVDKELKAYADKLTVEEDVHVQYMQDFSSGSWNKYRAFVTSRPDNAHQLDEKITFLNTKTTKKDYVSKRLNYALEPGNYDAWEELVSTLYEPAEREKIEWAIGAVVSGDARDLQKFLVLYGAAGTGKSTILNVIQELFDGYQTFFDAKSLTKASNTFSTEPFRNNPLVAIQHDGDLSRIEDNTLLNSIVSHETIPMSVKFQSTYPVRLNCFLFMGTNSPVKITDANSGMLRRLIDVRPSGRKVPAGRYSALMTQIKMQLGGIAQHCLDVYRKLGKSKYDAYMPLSMLYATNVMFNFVEEKYDVFLEQDGTTKKAAYSAYKEFCEDAGIVDKERLQLTRFGEELKAYFREFHEVTRVEGKQVRSWYSGFRKEKFVTRAEPPKEEPVSLVLDQTESLLDILLADVPAQYADENEAPMSKWANVKTTLKDLDTRKLHYVNVPESMNLAVVDFDIRNDKGEKDAELNLKEAAKWPPTYAEFSKGGAGIHLHYLYTGDLSKVSPVYAPGIEIKVFKGGASLRRRLSLCNNIPVATLSSGLPQKEEKTVVNFEGLANEKALRTLIKNCLEKKHHGATKPEIDLIFKSLEDAYKSGMKYDVTDLRPKIVAFANNSSHQAENCLRTVAKMHWKSEEPNEPVEAVEPSLVFFDVEVFPNLNIVCWKYDVDNPICTRLINPKPHEIEELMKYRLVGFNNLRYDNHILYAMYIGKSVEEIYELSKRIIKGSDNGYFQEAKNVSYTDIFDFAATKQSLKKWELEMDTARHKELDMDWVDPRMGSGWDQPVPREKWLKVAEYCDNDVNATRELWHTQKIQADWSARQTLAALSGLTVNDKTNSHTTAIIFGNDRFPQKKFNYRFMGTQPGQVETYHFPDAEQFPDLDLQYTLFDAQGRPVFPNYVFDKGKSTYRGEEIGEGGYVYAEPGVYYNVTLLDIASMHPSSIVAENLFGDEYTQRFKNLLDARIAIKHKDFEKVKSMKGFEAVLPFLDDEKKAEELSGALKIAINSVYGLTSAKFSNAFRDIRNKDNIVAKRGALFMVNLKHEVQRRGFTVAHIKTDSIKIPNATPEIIQFVMDYGKLYGYTFELESVYDRMCLVNDAVYIAHVESGKHAGEWVAVGKQFQHPYVFKRLFTHEAPQFKDMVEQKSVSTSLYLDYNENLGEDEHRYKFIGRVGNFCPVRPGTNGGLLLREKEGKFYAATGTKGYRWREAEVMEEFNMQGDIDLSYFEKLADEAKADISRYESYEIFSDLTRHVGCTQNCFECPEFHPMDSSEEVDILGGTCDRGNL